jgi:flagellar assembly factor FliW
MLLQTKHFGQIEVEEESFISFEEGLPGFENSREYVLINSADEASPFKWLQSVDEPQIAFAVVNPFTIKKDYAFELSDETVENLGIEKPGDVAAFSIMVVPEELEKMSMNLKAPVIINSKNRKAAQIILDTDKYTVRHYILDELRKQEVAVDAGADKEEGSDDRNE